MARRALAHLNGLTLDLLRYVRNMCAHLLICQNQLHGRVRSKVDGPNPPNLLAFEKKTRAT